MAAYYPENPTPERQEKTRQFMQLFPEMYPCKVCSDSFIETVKEHPPQYVNMGVDRMLHATDRVHASQKPYRIVSSARIFVLSPSVSEKTHYR